MTSQTNLDQDIVLGLRKNEASAQRTFYKKFYPKMYPVARTYCNSMEDAQEIINTGFLKVLTNIHNYKVDNFYGWVKTIIIRTSIDYVRMHNKKSFQTLELQEYNAQTYNEGISNLTIEEYFEKVKHIPMPSRAVFNLFVFEDFTHKEIAETLKISVGTSKWHLSNARKLFTQLIKA